MICPTENQKEVTCLIFQNELWCELLQVPSKKEETQGN